MTLEPSARTELLARLQRALAAHDELLLAFAYGSFVRQEAFRDLDIALLLRDPSDWRAAARIEATLSEQLRTLAVLLDVRLLNQAAPHFRRAVAEAGIVLREAQPGLARSFWVQAASEQMDLEAWRACRRKVA